MKYTRLPDAKGCQSHVIETWLGRFSGGSFQEAMGHAQRAEAAYQAAQNRQARMQEIAREEQEMALAFTDARRKA